MKHRATIVGLALCAAGLTLIPGWSVAAGETSRYPPVVPLEGTEPTDMKDGPAGDLIHLSRWIGDAAIVGLGEGTHGTHTLHRLPRRIFQHLAENLLWLHRTMFPGRRILALGHTSHTERRPGKMGAYLAETLGSAYRTVSMTAGSGSYRELGEMSDLSYGAPLEVFEIDPELSKLRTVVGRLHSGSFLLQLPKDLDAARALDPALTSATCPDVMVFVRGVEPIRRLP